MTKATRSPEDRRLRRKTAAFRLKHDVGKALRWSAPEAREADANALRARLLADLVPRARGGGAERDVLENFVEWKREEGPMFGAGDPDLKAVEEALMVVAAGRDRLLLGAEPSPHALPSPSSPSKKSLSPSSSSPPSSSSSSGLSALLALDDACLEASRACTAFYRRVAVEEGPEIVRKPPSGLYPRGRGGGGS